MVVKFLNVSSELTSKKDPERKFHIVSTIRKAGVRDNVKGTLVCDQTFISPEQYKLFKDCETGDPIEFVYEDYGRYRELVDINFADDSDIDL